MWFADPWSLAFPGVAMKEAVAYETAIDLLDADHKLVKKLFIDYKMMCEWGAPPDARQALATLICQAITVHAQIEEELFYPAVREATGDDASLDHAVEEHQQAKDLIARIEGMAATDDAYDEAVGQLADAIDEHVLEEREQIFLEAQQSALDLRALAVALFRRKQELTREAGGKPELPPTRTPEQIEEHA